ncbi:MAG: hypothetical protein ACR2M6_02620 [Vampirovibrionia bacterium]
MKNPKWKRIDLLEPDERERLILLCKSTKGLTLYGNRARSAVMLPANLAEEIAYRAEQESLSVGEVIINLLLESCGLEDER